MEEYEGELTQMWYILFIGMAWFIGENTYHVIKERRRFMVLQIVNNVLVLAADIVMYIPNVHPVAETVACVFIFWWLIWKLVFVTMNNKGKGQKDH